MREQHAYDVIEMPIPPRQRSTGTSAGIHPDDENSYPTNEQVATRRRPLADDFDDEPNSRMPRSSIRRRSATQAVTHPPAKEIHVIRHRRQDPSRLPVPVPQVQEKARTRIRLSWKVYFFGLLLLMFVGWMILNITTSVIHNVSDNLTYGNPRTAQYDKDVGHGGITHFIAFNLQGHIFVTEITNNDVTTSRFYGIIVLSGDNAALAPVTLSFVPDDTNPNVYDMMVSVAGGTYRWINTGTEFKEQQSS